MFGGDFGEKVGRHWGSLSKIRYFGPPKRFNILHVDPPEGAPMLGGDFGKKIGKHWGRKPMFINLMEPGQVDINLKTSINLACEEICFRGPEGLPYLS